MNWTSVEDALPETFTEVLVRIDGHRGAAWSNNYHLVAFLSESGKWWEERHGARPIARVTHWMPLPEPPDGEK